MAYHAVHALALQFPGSATPPDVHLTSFYVGVLHHISCDWRPGNVASVSVNRALLNWFPFSHTSSRLQQSLITMNVGGLTGCEGENKSLYLWVGMWLQLELLINTISVIVPKVLAVYVGRRLWASSANSVNSCVSTCTVIVNSIPCVEWWELLLLAITTP